MSTPVWHNNVLYRCPSEVGTVQYELQPLDNSSVPSINAVMSGELAQSCTHAHAVNRWILATLGGVCSLQLVAVAVLLRKVCVLRKRPRIRKRIIVNKNVTPLTSCPPLPQDQCEITIENCCNMNICETVSTCSYIYINANCSSSYLYIYFSYSHLLWLNLRPCSILWSFHNLHLSQFLYKFTGGLISTWSAIFSATSIIACNHYHICDW